ncbi:MAG: uracil-DNA glycosylase [Candidatus Aureabacteria bacterium]|nr:uracil-DNA glycosylase [Candidatus Auribacterota bacterium]
MDDSLDQFRDILRRTGNCLEELRQAGFVVIPREGSESNTGAGLGTQTSHPAESPPAAPPAEIKNPSLESLAHTVTGCRKCGLAGTRGKTVFGSGMVPAPVLFIGEAPGAEEDRQGLPFVGRAGQLLTKMLGAISLNREAVYITNVLKCRPPGNRDPLPDEVTQCEPYLLAQLQCVRPRLIVALGRHAAQTLLKTDTPIGRLRGCFHDYHGIPILPTYHPAYLLRNPAEKRKAWEDLKKVRAFLDQS